MKQKNDLRNPLARNSNIELLRIIAMFLVVLSHYSVFGQVRTVPLGFGFNRILLEITATGQIGVALFVMITGYYMIHKSFRVKRMMKLLIPVWFYYISFFVLFLILKKESLSASSIIHNLFPIITGQQWFVTAFVILSLFIPFINKVLTAVTRKQYIFLLAVLCFFNSFAPTFLDFDAYQYGGRISYMIMFYCVGAYIRLYPENLLAKKKRALLLAILCAGLMVASVLAIEIVGTKIEAIQGKTGKFYTVYSVLILLLAACLLVVFTQMRPRYLKAVNVVGGCTYGIYIIHLNPYMSDWLWKNVCNNIDYAHSNWLWLHMLLCVCAVYIGCTAIEYLRKYILEKYVFRKPVDWIVSCAEKVYAKGLNSVDRILQKVPNDASSN